MKERADAKSDMMTDFILESEMSAWINQVFDDWFGDYSFGLPTGVCKAMGYSSSLKMTTKTKNALSLFGQNLTTISSFTPSMRPYDEAVKELLTNTRFRDAAGEKDQISEDIYSYAFDVKLSSERDNLKYAVYLYNNCTPREKSLIDERTILHANNAILRFYGSNLVFHCSDGPCRFNEACVKWEDESFEQAVSNGGCFPLNHGTGFLNGSSC